MGGLGEWVTRTASTYKTASLTNRRCRLGTEHTHVHIYLDESREIQNKSLEI